MQIECQRGNVPLWTKVYAIFRDCHRVSFPKKSKAHTKLCNAAIGFSPDGLAGWLSRVLNKGYDRHRGTSRTKLGRAVRGSHFKTYVQQASMFSEKTKYT